ncbi:glucose-6-phosphate dehydrogenase [Inquilinus sp. CA228]|uniref:glucose-6-phosphate dehydrogenase n=1 Tax=Inquilinus sp. CA228 TaxID=3455609 RepID=UPI003F8D754C
MAAMISPSPAKPAGTPAAPPCTFVIFGASGDLTGRLLTPALYHLMREGLLDPGFEILGVDRVENDDAGFRKALGEALHTLGADAERGIDEAAWERLAAGVRYLTGDFADPGTYARLAEHLARRAEATGHANAVFYLAVAPRFFAPIAASLATAALLVENDGGFRRLVVEKPFGTDLASARELNARLLAAAAEKQIYRIDHYLGKETVQNIMAFRFGNGIFEPIWDRDHIEHVQITAAETVGVERRGRFYDGTGALRDMVPNHLFQLLAMTAMEAPNSFAADAVRTEKTKVIEALRDLSPDEVPRAVVRGQYGAGTVLGKPRAAYRQEPDVAPNSRTETYLALKASIDNWRWSGVPFYLRTGKSLAVRRTEIAIQFKRAPAVLFRDTAGTPTPNLLVIRIQPDEGISLRFAAKVPGREMRLGEVEMDFRYAEHFKAEPQTGYETLIYDCLIGDPTLFQRADNIEAGWGEVQPIQERWAAHPEDPALYPAGSDGPVEADELLARDGYRWLPLS